MDNLIYIQFICIAAPLLLMVFLLPGRSRLILGYMIIGIFLSLFVSEINGLIFKSLPYDELYITTTFTPITEEIVKAFPILFYAYVFSNSRERVIPLAIAIGIGFALFENMVILLQNVSEVTVFWAIIRGFSTALMHGVCTSAIGFGICFVRKHCKLFYSGTFSLLTLAIIYHGIFNMLVQSRYNYLGFVLPVLTYMPIIAFQLKYYSRKKMTERQKKTS